MREESCVGFILVFHPLEENFLPHVDYHALVLRQFTFLSVSYRPQGPKPPLASQSSIARYSRLYR